MKGIKRVKMGIMTLAATLALTAVPAFAQDFHRDVRQDFHKAGGMEFQWGMGSHEQDFHFRGMEFHFVMKGDPKLNFTRSGGDTELNFTKVERKAGGDQHELTCRKAGGESPELNFTRSGGGMEFSWGAKAPRQAMGGEQTPNIIAVL
jgi:hypothetical protein